MASNKKEVQARKRANTQKSNISDRSNLAAENHQVNHPILHLQRQAGNTAVTQAIQRRQDSPPQAKQGRIQREDDDGGLWDTLLQGGKQILGGDFGGGAETFSESESVRELPSDAIDFFGDLLSGNW